MSHRDGEKHGEALVDKRIHDYHDIEHQTWGIY